jgi:hypothetical protein
MIQLLDTGTFVEVADLRFSMAGQLQIPIRTVFGCLTNLLADDGTVTFVEIAHGLLEGGCDWLSNSTHNNSPVFWIGTIPIPYNYNIQSI